MTDTASMMVQWGNEIYTYELGVTERSLQKVQSAIDADPEHSTTRWAHAGCWARHSTCIGANCDEEAAARQQAFVDRELAAQQRATEQQAA
jgi:hypothetical protein